MTQFRTKFNSEELRILHSLVGAEWICYGGSSFVYDGKFAVGNMFIESAAGTVTIASDLVECPLPTGPEDVAELHVTRGSTDVGRSRGRGALFFHEKNHLVAGLSIVSACVTIQSIDYEPFQISMDHAVTFHFEDHDLVIARGSWFVETLDVLRSNKGSEVDVRSAEWDSELGTYYEVTQWTSSIEELVLE